MQRQDNGTYESNRLPVDIQYRLVTIQGQIQTSLFDTFTALGENPQLIYSVADIFSSKVDFNTETRKGDSFTVMVPKYYKEDVFLGYGKVLYASYKQTSRTLQAYFFQEENDPGSGGYFDENGKDMGTSFIRSPVPFGRVTSRFTFRRKHPILGVVRPHLGIDLAAPIGTPIMAASDGKVAFAGRKGGFGKQIILKHPNGYKTFYGHLSRFAKGLRKGRYVKQKEIIGYVGSTGMSTGPHLDYRLQHNGVFKNPFKVRFQPKKVLKGESLQALNSLIQQYAGYLQSGNPVVMVKNITIDKETTISLL